MRQFLTATDIEDLAARGVRQIPVGDDFVLTDVARERAVQLGIALVNAAAPAPSGPHAPPPPAPSAARTPAALTAPGSKPKGCLHHHPLPGTAPATALGSTPSPSGTPPGSAVDQLVEAVRRLNR